MSTVLCVSQQGKSFTLNPNTPLVSEVLQRLESGMNLLTAVHDLMEKVGPLGGGGDPAFVNRDRIAAAFSRLQEAGLILMEPGKKHVLFTTLGDPADPVQLELEKSTGTAVARGDAELTLSAKAKLELALDVLGPDAAAGIGLPLAAADVLHRCHFGGGLGVGGGIKTPPFEARGSVDLGAGITWYFERHRHDTVLGSLIDAAHELREGIRPWELEEVRRVLEQPENPGRHLDGLRAIDVRVERTLRASGTFSVQRGFIREAELRGASGPEKIKLAAIAKASFGFTASRSGEFTLRLTRSHQDVLLELTQTRASNRGREFNAGVEVGISGLDSLAQGWIDTILPPLHADLRGKLERWSKPGEMFIAKLKASLGAKWGTQLLPLAELMLGEVSAPAAAEAMSGQLIDRWAAMLNERIELFSGRSDAAATRLLDATASDGVIEAKLKETIRAELVKVIDSLRADIRGEINVYVSTLKGKSKEQLGTLLSPLEAFGSKVQDLVTAVGSKASRVVAEIEKLLTQYEAWRKALTDAAQKAAGLKIAANLAIASTYESGESRQVLLRFAPAANTAAQAVFRRLVLGQGEIDLEAISTLQAEGAGVYIEDGDFSTYAEGGRSVSLSLDLFGLKFSDARILSSEVAIAVDASGRISAFNGKAKQADISNNRRTMQSATFSADFDLLATDAVADRLPGTLALAFELVSKKPLKAKALSQFLDSFVDAKLIEDDQAHRAALRLADETSNPLSISIELSGLASVMQRAAAESDMASLQAEVLEHCLAFIAHRPDTAERLLLELPFEYLLERVRGARTYSGATRAANASADWIEANSAGRIMIPVSKTTGNLRKAMTHDLIALYQAVTSIPRTVQALGEIGKLAAATRGVTLSDSDAIAARDRFDALLQALQDAAEPAADVSEGVYRALASERLPDRTLALLATFARLGAGSDFHARVVMHRVRFSSQGQRELGERLAF